VKSCRKQEKSPENGWKAMFWVFPAIFGDTKQQASRYRTSADLFEWSKLNAT
jgi:hypothetical protein